MKIHHRIKQISILKSRYARAMRGRHWKLANQIYARLRPLITSQLKYENRKCA